MCSATSTMSTVNFVTECHLDLSQLSTSTFHPHLRDVFWARVEEGTPIDVLPVGLGLRIEYHPGRGFAVSYLSQFNYRPLLTLSASRETIEKIFNTLDEMTGTNRPQIQP